LAINLKLTCQRDQEIFRKPEVVITRKLPKIPESEPVPADLARSLTSGNILRTHHDVFLGKVRPEIIPRSSKQPAQSQFIIANRPAYHGLVARNRCSRPFRVSMSVTNRMCTQEGRICQSLRRLQKIRRNYGRFSSTHPDSERTAAEISVQKIHHSSDLANVIKMLYWKILLKERPQSYYLTT